MAKTFEINEGDLPFVRTRQALLVLDLQNDLVSTGAMLYVDKPPNFLEQIINLAGAFRRAGSIIWIRSQFETHRPVNTGGPNAEMVITDNELPGASSEEKSVVGRRSRPSKLLELYSKMIESHSEEDNNNDDEEVNAESEPEEPYDNETFLSLELGKEARCVLPLSLGVNFSQLVAQAKDTTKDIIFTKTHYSAFKSGALLQTLRGQFVTELFICGALTNISIFATAMDAARHGYTITLVEDCLGYRSKARHDEALRQLVEATGCEVMSSAEVIEDIRAKERALSRSSNARRPVRDTQDYRDIHELMANLKLKKDKNTASAAATDMMPQLAESKPPSDVSALKSKSKASEQVMELTPEPDDAPDAAPLIRPPRKTQDDERKRVQSKIKTRRHLSKTSAKDAEELGSDLNKKPDETQEVAKAPLSPTHLTLAAAAESLEKVPPRKPVDPDTPKREESLISTVVEHNSASTEAEKLKPEVTTIKTKVKHERDKDSKPERAEKPITPDSPAVSDMTSNAEKDYTICEGDSMIIHNILSEKDVKDIFERVRDEVRWQKMSHQGGEVPRLVAVQGKIGDDGSIPIYRHPADESPPLLPFTPTISLIKSEVEKRLGHNVNHCLIQFYRSGTDYISEHSDKTLDIAPNSFIANVSLGAMRTMTLRTKKVAQDPNAVLEEAVPRLSCKAPLPHNSMCKMGLITNMKWLHSIRQDKRAPREKSEAELAFEGGRISLTFRLIGTFLDRDQVKIWGQGATAKEQKDARPVINGETPETDRMLWAFGKENHSSEFTWEESYGKGFDVLHISITRKLFLSGDDVIDLRAQLILAEYNLPWVVGKPTPFFSWKGGNPQADNTPVPEALPIRLVDNDLSRAQVQGDLAILLYLDASYSPARGGVSQLQKARQYTRLQFADALLQQWRAKPVDIVLFQAALSNWDIFAAEDLYIAGPVPSVADYAFWPLLQDILQELPDEIDCPNLITYYERMLKREAVQKVIASLEVLGSEKK
jgi:nicotinamidase-related amidase/alkylated DNA repair dioxygenase AlkB